MKRYKQRYFVSVLSLAIALFVSTLPASANDQSTLTIVKQRGHLR